MFPGSGGQNPNPNMQMPGFGMPQPINNVISAPPIITGRFNMGMPPTMMGGMFPGAGLGMMPNPAMGNPMVPGMFSGMGQNVPPSMGQGQPAPVVIPTEPPVDLIDPALRKVFVKNISEDVPDTFMESILKECGNVTQWKRTKNEKDIPLRFGTCEFETVEGMLRCLRIMNNLPLLGSYLQINASDKTEAFIGEWTETRKKEWQATKEQSAREEDFERYLQKDDANALERIHILIDNFDINKAREAKEKEEEKKEHPKEKERDRKKKTQIKELEKNFKKELQKWQEYEDKMDKDRRKDKERERERDHEKEKFKQRLLEKELEYDSEEERRRKNNTKYLEQRKKTRQKELEEDELERRKEIMEEEEKRKANEENQMEIEPPMENIMPIHSHEMEVHDGNPLTRPDQPHLINPKPKSKFMFQTIEPGVQEPAPEAEGGKPTFQIDIGGPAQKVAKGGAQTMFKEDMEREDEAQQLYNRKHKIQAKVEKPITTTENVVTVDPNTKSATIQFGVTVPVAPTNEAQKVLSELQGLIKQIPTNKNDLFNYKINWTLLATSDLIEKKVKPWLKKQSVEYIGQEEMEFVNMILKRLANRESPQKIMKKVEQLLDEEAEDFTMKLWRMLIFELLKLEHTSQLDTK